MLSHPALLYCLTACTQPFEASPPPAPSGPLQAPPVVMDSACARITFMFSGSSGISVAFPNRDACTDGVVVIPGGPATRSGSGSKNANIPIRLLNRTGYTIESPPTVVLAPGGRMILEPAGGSPNKLTPQNHDSVRAGSWIWQVGGAGTVAAGDSTLVETLVVRLDSPASSAQMTFTVEAQLLSAGGWPLFTTTAPVLDPSKTVAVPGTDVVYFRTSGTLLFKEGVSDQAKQQFFAENGLAVRGVTTSGLFFVSFPDPGESLAALEAFVESIGSKPEVLTFGPDILSGIRENFSARFPTDGLQRTAWFSSGQTPSPLWAMRAIRAPQAWGCETGNYTGSAPAEVGLLEFVHDTQHDELAQSFQSHWSPAEDSALIIASSGQGGLQLRATYHQHAVATGGILTASGDDGRGIAGTAWRTRLQLYSLWTTNRYLLPPSQFHLLRSELARRHPRVLSISAGYRGPTVPLQQRLRIITELANGFRQTLSADLPSLLVVVAADNKKVRVAPASYDSMPNADFILAALLRLRLDPNLSNRIIVVAGTEPGNAFWATNAYDQNEGSNSFTGATDIGAPAHDVIVMDTLANGVVGIRNAVGTSLSAPMVAGAASLLLAMDPSLSAGQFKDYLLRGAQVPRFDSTTGVASATPSVQNVPNATFWQLDVYGALSLLSRERPGAPICGYPVGSGGSYAAPHVVLEKNGPLQPVTDSIKVPGAFDGYLGLITVAPGGRIISVYAQRDSLSNGNQAVIQFNHLGQRLGAQSGVWGGRHYLERYIVDHRQMGFGSSIWQELTLRQPNGDFVAQIPQLKLPDGTVIGTFNPWWIEVSPDARFVAFSAGQGTYVQRFADNSTTYIGDPGSVSWSKDGTRLLVFESDGQTMDFRTYQVDATAHGGFTPGQTASTSSSRVFLYDVSMFAGDDAVFYSGESDSMGGSWVVARPVTALAVNGTEGAVPARGFRNIGNVATVNP